MNRARLATVAVGLLLVGIPAAALPIDLDSTAFDGTSKVVVIPLEFLDVKGVQSPLSFQNLFFAEGETERSVRDYFHEVSGGAATFGGYVVPRWFTSAHSMGSYGEADGRDPTPAAGFIAKPPLCSMALEAVRLADPYVDFSQFVDPATGSVRIVVIHAGTAQDSGTTGLDVWSHMWTICDANWNWGPFMFDGVPVSQYMTTSEFSPLGTNVHELGHLSLGLPDLYLGSNPARSWDLMASGSWDGDSTSEPLDTHLADPRGTDPSHLGPYFKSVLGWNAPLARSAASPAATFELEPAEAATGLRTLRLDVDTNVCWTQRLSGPHQIAWQGNGARYFLIEYRSATAGNYDGGRGPAGIVTWFIDECAAYGNWWGMNTDVAKPRVRVIQPDASAMGEGQALSPISTWSSTIDGRHTGWFVEVVDLGSTATVRVGHSAVDVRLYSPVDSPSASTSRGSTGIPSAYAHAAGSDIEAQGPSVMRKDASIQFRVDGPATWTLQLVGAATVTPTCTVLSTITCKLPSDTPEGDYVIQIRATDGSTARHIDSPVRVV